MEVITIGGWEFPRHPPGVSKPIDTVRRWAGVLASLEFARSQLTPADRALWVELCRAEAKVRTLHRDAAAAVEVVGEGPTWLSEAAGL